MPNILPPSSSSLTSLCECCWRHDLPKAAARGPARTVVWPAPHSLTTHYYHKYTFLPPLRKCFNFFIIPVLWFTSISIWNWDFSWVKGNHCLRNLITLADKTWHIIIVYKTFLFTQYSGRHDSPTDNTNKYRLSALANTSKQMINVIKKIFRQQITEDLTPVNNNNPG